ncbi:hypothetical protein C8R43DRAFT_1234296 [Mycena crocata]|nr:hypothetical protein C8R43DRAFT_1234296 [Mycena crocata]
MHPTYLLCIILGAAATLAAPTSPRNNLTELQESESSSLSSHAIPGGIVDEVHPAPNPSDIVLPPIEKVFAMMAMTSTSTTSTQPASPSTTTLSTTHQSATAEILHLGPGLVVSPTIARIEIAPTTSSSANTDPLHEAPTLTHKFIFVSVVLLSMMAVILAVYAVSYQRTQMRMHAFNLAMEDAPVFAKGGGEKEMEKGRNSVVHITRNFPGSKFSVTSSDYPISARASSACESESDDTSSDADDDEVDLESYERGGRGLMDPAHFFALRASSMASSRRHSRGGSAPSFGIPRFDARREQSRRSRSVASVSEEWR